MKALKSRGLTTGRGVTESDYYGCEACTVVQIFTMVYAIELVCNTEAVSSM